MIRFVVVVALLTGSTAHAAFSETSRRYLAPRDVFNLLEQKFPVVKDPVKAGTLRPTCSSIERGNANLTGVTVPAIGAPAAPLPMPGYVRWLGSCGVEVIGLQFKDKPSWPSYFPPSLARRYPAAEWETKAWTSLSESERREILRHQVTLMIGPDGVVKDLGLAADTDEIVAALMKLTAGSGNIIEAARASLLALLLREEFISY